MTTGLSRREFLAAANAAAFLLFLESCSLGPLGRSAASPSIPPGSSAYEQALKLLRDAVRASPDHLVRRAADVVATRDATKIVEFVRDRIAVLPPFTEYDDPASSRKWGSAATLRGGQGTLRDRAELLAEMLTQAGFKAQVQAAQRPSAITLDGLYAPRSIAFSPDQSRIDLARKVLHQAGFPAATAQHAFAPGPDPVTTILSALPAAAQVARIRNDLLPQLVPLVVFQDGGKQRYALAIQGVGIMDTTPAKLVPHDAEAVRNITITVSALCNPPLGGSTPRGQIVDLVTATWPADQVVGRQVLLTFMPTQGPKAILDSGLALLPVRVPILRLQTDSPPVGANPDLTVPGKLITVQGDVLGPASVVPTEAAGMAGPFGTLQVLSDSDRTTALGRVTSIKAVANAAAFTEVELEVAVNDSTGAAVNGLDSRSFAVKEQGTAVDSFTLYSNVKTQSRPRVLVVYDGYVAFSPNLFKTDADKSAFESALATALATQAAKTPFDVQVVGLGVPPDPQGWAPPDTGHISAALTAAHETADDPWGTVGGPALEQGVTAIILVSDMNAADTDPARVPTYQRRVIMSRVPVFTVPVGNIDEATASSIVSISGGSRLDAADPATPTKLMALVAPLASTWISGAYRIRYQAHSAGPSQRAVTVGLAGKTQPVGTATYQVPAQSVPAPAFAGLYVTIAFGPLSATRRLAGVEIRPDGSPLGPLDDPEVVTETRAALDGVTTIAIEPGTPTSAAMLDDVLSSMLTIAPAIPIWNSANHDQILAALKSGVRRAPFVLPALLRPINADPASVPGLRVAIFQERAPSDIALEEHADLAVGLNEVVPLTTDRHAAFKAAVATSVAACAAEAATYPDTAYARLSGRPLTPIPEGDYAGFSAWLKTVPPDRLASWNAIYRVYENYHLLAPDAGAVDALWVVDPITGVAKAVLLDSTGGGFVTKNCHPSDFAKLALIVAELCLICAAVAEVYPIWCAGINTAGSGMCVVALFNNEADIGTPLGAILPWLNLGEAGFAGFEAALGVMLMALTLAAEGCL
jgi:hypothetical protein